ncbi:MAG: hypothetical protein AABW54_02595 [Candidatus Micrarchaeota archaeon]
MARNGISDAVNRILDEMGFLRLALHNDLINYSALARFIMPLVTQKTGRKEAGMDAVIMAVRRYVRGIKAQERNASLLSLLGDSKIVLRTGMSLLHLRRASDLYWRLVEVEKSKVNWHLGDKMNIIQRSEEIAVIASQKLLPYIYESTGRSDILAEWHNLALITIEYPPEANSTPGTLSFITGQLESINVNIVAIYNTMTKLSLVVSEQDASKSYERLSNSLAECRQASVKMPVRNARQKLK